MNTIRLLQVVPSLGCGGAERMVVNLMTHLNRQRFEVAAAILNASEGGALERKLTDEGFQVSYLGRRPGFDPRIPLRIRNVVRQFRPHVVHSHLCLHYAYLSLIRHGPVSHVNTAHLPGETRYRRVIPWFKWVAFRQGVVPVAVSGHTAEWVKHVYGLPNCTVIPNGIPIGHFGRRSDSRRLWRREQGFEENDVLFVCVARLEEQKNHALLLAAFAHGLGLEPRACLLLAGEGELRRALEAKVRELGLQRKVRFLGQLSNVSDVLGAADVFVLASRNEGNPLSVMEAMAAGLPVVATDVGGVPELVEDQRTGTLVRSGDCGGLAAAMLHLFRNPGTRRTMAAHAAQRAQRDFSASRMVQGYTDLYERLVAEQVQADKTPRTEMFSPSYR